MSGSDSNNSSKRKPHRRPQVLDASAYLLWDDEESVDHNLDHHARYGAPYARARRIQVAFAEADAGGMPWPTLLIVLTDWAALAHRRAPHAVLSRAIEYAYQVAERGVSCTDAAQHVRVMEREHECSDDDDDPAVLAAFGLYQTITSWIAADPADDSGMGEGGWSMAADMLWAVSELAREHSDEGVLAAIETLNQCAKAMHRRLYAWSALTPDAG